ncbi:DNA-3-methyladenine glycosylase 2 family protein [Rhodococcus kronopolitis]|uniref:DNA-3-methyladenine glycosylase II n=1 Tax=Rhodococcus kronopolitis TaxID=1460226 RepID=A0ABV9FWE6_9NOCA
MTAPHLDFERCYRAVSSRDARFDGQFITAVRTTGIYCRPSCPAITPKPGNVTFLPTAAAAQQAGYRACRRCLPDAAPGSPLWHVRSDLAARAMRLIADGAVERGGVAALSASLGYSTRQLTRALTSELGAGPLALARAHRAHTARLLIQTTAMPMSDVAFAAGFSSIRQFNDTVREVFAATPSTMRAEAARRTDGDGPTAGTVRLRLPYRGPLDTGWLTWQLSAHAVDGLERCAAGEYRRALRLPHGTGVAAVRISAAHQDHAGHVLTELTLRDMRDLAPAVARLRHLLDLDADPQAVDAALSADPDLSASVDAAPGIRVLGSLDAEELLLRTMIGQQVSVAAAATATARLVAHLGEPVEDAVLTHGFPSAAAVAARGREVLAGPARRIDAVVGVAAALADGALVLHGGRTSADLRAELLTYPGIGPWTADYVTMRTLADPDVLLHTDLVVRQGAAALGIDLAGRDRWSPWRSYASMHLWRTALVHRGVIPPTLPDSEDPS